MILARQQLARNKLLISISLRAIPWINDSIYKLLMLL